MSNDYPLFCFNGLSSDVFAGWYSGISSASRCQDFCFWKQPDAYYQQEGNLTYEIADPHQITELPNGATWGCLVDATGEDITWRNAFDIFEDYGSSSSNGTFPHLKCSRGAGQQLKSTVQDVARSISFWYALLFVTIFILGCQIFYFCFHRRKRGNDYINNNTPAQVQEGARNDITEATQANSANTLQKTSNQKDESISSFNTWLCSKKLIGTKILKVLLFVFDIAILFIMLVSIIALLEVQQGIDLPFALTILTPTCANTESLCRQGREPIERILMNQSKSDSFSYIIASDPQLNWYDGDSAYIGQMTYPPQCSSNDSCGSCTKKLAFHTNNQMKISFERLIHENDTFGSVYPPPKTLVVNGDLTQYFHRFEKRRYMSIYHDIAGLEQFFPGLGNHDYDQGEATFDNDEWVGPKYCNGRHGVAYVRSAFCGRIPKFDARRRLTRYDPDSLAYSWEEGNFHFVQVHYYPLFENAAIGVKSSLRWVERDLKIANSHNLTSILFIHSVYGIPRLMERILLENKVAAIFAGHLHRCFGTKCDLLRALNTKEAENYFNNTDENKVKTAEKCFPASAALCGTNANGNGLFYLRDASANFTLPDRKLFSKVPDQSGPCPVGKYATYINTTDNTALCTGRILNGSFPFTANENETSIPVFWSGSASYETFLLVNFQSNRIVVNMMTATVGNEGQRYVDTHSVPNAVYPSHDTSDLEQVVIYV
mmetsp:Transcript_11756/g.21974  ORF Transcript_11756/g.21974 Transcript_11756/m.21974 type:complete len:715 (+) Transcript_11756:137-2281(+)|eukprot:CAMPEP_0176479202 /NCGR_PEP_ID=MMETSP0200_2-20121128/1614_1 /TAXON_ID=947934 /ORGANISM="Chaetoceros sp., Strain GSL56" /LENGTH=714 /DNA_ID=CAMNT_0017875231 /DNA_START=81 /DNA_END=2225 /DNA_ORIENTATION=+